MFDWALLSYYGPNPWTKGLWAAYLSSLSYCHWATNDASFLILFGISYPPHAVLHHGLFITTSAMLFSTPRRDQHDFCVNSHLNVTFPVYMGWQGAGRGAGLWLVGDKVLLECYCSGSWDLCVRGISVCVCVFQTRWLWTEPTVAGLWAGLVRLAD